jgi:corrinoid protein of di/trimethylamine methyltransferase
MEALLERLKSAVVNLDIDEAKRVAEAALEAGVKPLDAIEKGLAKGIRVVGDRFEKGEAFLAELVVAAEAMKVAMSVFEPVIRRGKYRKAIKGKVVIGTVEGDIHDIGKNIVGAILSVFGFEVYDLGVNVPSEKFVEKVGEIKADIVGMSALLTTTMPKMKEIVEALEKANLRDKVKVIVGGAPVSEEWAEEIGADAYAADAMEAVKVTEKLISK